MRARGILESSCAGLTRASIEKKRLFPKRMDCRVISAFTRVLDARCPVMTPAVLRITPRADGSHVGVAVFIVNNRPETMERIRPHVEVGSPHDAAAGRRAPVCLSGGRPGFLIPISRCQTALLNAAPQLAAAQVIASACSAVASQGDAANSMNCGSISGCVGAMSVRIHVPSLRTKNSSGSQASFHRRMNRSR
jgi:hypothetical protein